ncbi:NADH-quinone oxidoreductase subunit H [Dermatophilaceae bacterium Sec6.4]
MNGATTSWSVLGVVVQVMLVIAGAPVLVALMRQVRARLEGRVGAGLGQPWRDLRKQLRKESIAPDGSTMVFAAAPAVALSSMVLIVCAAPFITTTSPLDGVADLFAVVSLLLVASIALALAGLDTGSAFGGMGSSRTVTVAALAEPTLLVAGFALSVQVGSSNLASLVEHGQRVPGTILSPASLLAAVALWIVVVAEAGRLPVDNPSTHLELTMIHEATILEYAGPDLAMVELGSAMRLAVLLGLWGNLFLPWGVATTAGPGTLALGAIVFVVKVAALGAVLAASEVFMAKWRLFRVPELLAGSFLFSVLAVSSSFFLS